MTTNRALRAATAIAALALVLAACGGADASPDPEGPSLVTLRTPDGSTYTVRLEGPDARRAWESLGAEGRIGIPSGRILPGDGGINSGHDWHVVEVELVDMAMEVCDGNAGYIDDLGYEGFLSQHGDRFCPWDARVVEVRPAG